MSVEQTQQTMDLHFEGLESDAFSQYFVDDVTWKAIAPTAWRQSPALIPWGSSRLVSERCSRRRRRCRHR